MKTLCSDVFARFLVPGLVLVLSAVMLGTEPPERRGASAVEKKTDSVDRDYRDQLPRTAATRPLEAVAELVPRPGFRVEVVAAEPLVQDPVAMEFDENGRLFVCEMPEYNQYANAGFRGKGRVRCLEDTDGNGVFDRSRIFADGIDSPTSVACWKGGVFVGSVPDILYLKDTDGDGTADVRRVVFTGFSRDKAGEAMLNSFRWGLDNRFHVSTNLAGGTVRRGGEKADKGVSVRGRGFLFDPRSESFELSSGGGQHGMSMDNWGRKFVCQNSVPAQLVVYDDRYLARNKFLAGPAPAINIVPSGKQTRLFRRSPIEPWRKLRTRLRSQGLIPGSDEGGKPGGFFTGVTGVTIYRGDAWPEAYRGNLLIGEVSNNLLFRARLEDAGVSLVASRADAGAEFLASKSVWFRPVQLANAPDGTLYVIDMARELIEGAAFLADGQSKVNHYCLDLADWHAVKVMCDHLTRNNVPIIYGPS
ncbi:MAG: PVC-type heme-binding CxxCH protein, partial [Planctomycetota bacterium]|nr:PVC-type heme-binding CxxCH protein [Planctomycetota bacterium]